MGHGGYEDFSGAINFFPKIWENYEHFCEFLLSLSLSKENWSENQKPYYYAYMWINNGFETKRIVLLLLEIRL